MARTVKELFRDAAELSDADRAELAALLLESLEGEPDEGVEAAWAEEIERRVREIENGEVETIPWEEVRAKLFARLNDPALGFIRPRTAKLSRPQTGTSPVARLRPRRSFVNSIERSHESQKLRNGTH